MNLGDLSQVFITQIESSGVVMMHISKHHNRNRIKKSPGNNGVLSRPRGFQPRAQPSICRTADSRGAIGECT